jgi:hypothetical protein
MYLKAPTTWLAALVAGISGGSLVAGQVINPGADGPSTAGGLRLVTAYIPGGNNPTSYVASNSTLAALINSGARTISVPAGYGVMLLEVPAPWVQTLAGTVAMPTNGPLQLTSECGIDAQGGWSAQFQSIGFTVYVPNMFPVPPVNC